ncbi:MAG: PilZ domain-containing protein [bacterium]
MEPDWQERHFLRFKAPPAENGDSPLSIYIPDLAEGPVTLLNFSSGGFLISLSTSPPEPPRPPFTCSIWVHDISLTEFKAEIVWVRPNEDDPATWAVGVSVDMPEDKRDHYASLLTAMLNGDRPEA